MRVAAAVLVAPMLAACVEHRTIDLPLDAHSFEYGFIALVNDVGVATRASPPFGVADGRLTFGELPVFQLEPNESEVLLVELPEGALGRAAPKFDEERAAELELLLSVPTQLPFFLDEALALGVELPGEARVTRGELESTLEAAAAPTDLALQIPIAPERCSRATPPGLEPYGATANVIDGDRDTDSENFFFVDQLDERALIAMTPKYFHLFHAGEAYQPSPVTFASAGNRLGAEAMPRRYSFGGYSLDREAGTVWLAASAAPRGMDVATEGVLLELAVDATRIEIVRTASLTAMPLVAVGVDLDRKPVLLAVKGGVFRYDEGFVALPPITTLVGDETALRLHATGDPKYRYLASSTGQVHVFNADTQRWESFRVPVSWLRSFPVEDGYNASGLASERRPDGRLELWAAGSSNVLIHRIDAGPWETYPLEFPPSFAGCAAPGEYPDLTDTAGFDSIEIVGPDLFVSVRECSGLLQIRPSEECAAMISVGGVRPEFLRSDLQAIDVLGGNLVLGGEDGLLYRSTLR